MERRLLLAIGLSILLMLLWSAMLPKPYPIVDKEVITKPTIPASSFTKSPLLTLLPEPAATDTFVFRHQQSEITFVESRAAIKEVVFKGHQDYRFALEYGFMFDDPSLVFTKESSTANTVRFVHSDQSKKIIKDFIFSPLGYGLKLAINVQSESKITQVVNLPLILGVQNFSSRLPDTRYQDIVIAQPEKTIHVAIQKGSTFSQVKFLALREKYFCAIIAPQTVGNWTANLKKISPDLGQATFTQSELRLAPGQSIEEKFSIYLGPQELRSINSINPEWSSIVNYGTFDFIGQILFQLLQFFFSLVHNWGWAIVLLSVAVYLLLFPLSLRQMRSMKQMQVLQPEIDALRKAYKDHPQKMNQEIMQLYRKYKLNPFSGCLPLILQMPIFFALYQVLSRAIALKGATFFWIKDLAAPDRFPIAGREINILPIIMAVIMFLQQKFSLASTSTGSHEQQKMMLIMMPVMFGFIFYRMPAGLVLYWLINSALMFFYQWRISRSL